MTADGLSTLRYTNALKKFYGTYCDVKDFLRTHLYLDYTNDHAIVDGDSFVHDDMRYICISGKVFRFQQIHA